MFDWTTVLLVSYQHPLIGILVNLINIKNESLNIIDLMCTLCVCQICAIEERTLIQVLYMEISYLYKIYIYI